MKQETLEEVAERYASQFYKGKIVYHGFIEGAEWMQERMYSEEEVKKLIIDFLFTKGIGREVGSVNEWFEQFKKTKQDETT